MSRPRLGSMFSGVGGLDLAVSEVLGTETVFVADVCKVNKDGSVGHHEPHRSPCSVLAHRFPGVPNLGDVSLIDWSPWHGRIEILSAGFPCQDVSVAGGRAGLRDGTRTGLWSQVVRAITELSPRLVVLENVPGIFTAPAAGDVEPCPICLGDGPGEHLRALDAVLADLAAIGFDADWTVVPASGVGAAHRRERWFCTAYPAGQPWSFEHGDCGTAADAGQSGRRRWTPEFGGSPSTLPGVTRDMALLPSPRTSDTNGAGHHGDGGMDLRTAVAEIPLLPTPMANEAEKAVQGPRLSDGQKYLSNVVHDLLPTPRATDGTKGGPNQRGSSGDLMLPSAVQLLPTPTATDSKSSGAAGYDSGHDGTTLTDATVRQPAKWGEYEPAIRRWESVTRPAPEPTKLNAKGNPKLSDEFDEWLMGYSAGWITDVPGVTWNEVLKACGNGGSCFSRVRRRCGGCWRKQGGVPHDPPTPPPHPRPRPRRQTHRPHRPGRPVDRHPHRRTARRRPRAARPHRRRLPGIQRLARRRRGCRGLAGGEGGVVSEYFLHRRAMFISSTASAGHSQAETDGLCGAISWISRADTTAIHRFVPSYAQRLWTKNRHSSAAAGRIASAKDEAAPGHRLRQQSACDPGPRRPLPSERRERLMAILPYPADSAAPPSPGALGNADGCPSCVMNVEPPRSVVEIADGHRCAYLCSDCGHAWTTDWRD